MCLLSLAAASIDYMPYDTGVEAPSQQKVLFATPVSAT